MNPQDLPRIRTFSVPRPYTPDNVSSLRQRGARAVSVERSRGAEILSPIPQRHLIHTNESNRWLHSPTASVASSSRAVSPLAYTSSTHKYLSPSTNASLAALLDRAETRPPNEKAKEDSSSLGRRWIRWMHASGMKSWVTPSVIVGAFFWKSCIGFSDYSGHATPPMYGDYEAQRHWMEITQHLPLLSWYKYDLQYWGLDYPPLTAYHSWICGRIGTLIDETWFAFDTSRGIETAESKLFMRMTVLFWDLLVYVPAVVFFVKVWLKTRSTRAQSMALLTILFQPALLLIDFGHFQFNSLMLGLTLLTIDFFATGDEIFGAVCFVLSLGFKQMALYYAPVVGCYLLGKCIASGFRKGVGLFFRLGFTTILTFILLFLPWLPPFGKSTSIFDPITRIFPFGRGLFEDKVANFWCATNVVLKWKQWASPDILIKASAALTALGFTPNVLGLLPLLSAQSRATPKLGLLPYALLASSMSFFLFSFQVHEKTILVPLLPMTLLLSGASPTSSTYAWGALMNNIGVFSMWPLLKRDGLALPYVASLILWNLIIGYNPFTVKPKSFVKYFSILVYAAAIAVHILQLLIPPPSRYPDIFPVLHVLISTPVFALVWLWSIKCGIEMQWALGGVPSKPPAPHSPEVVRVLSPAPSRYPEGDSSKSYRRENGSASWGRSSVGPPLAKSSIHYSSSSGSHRSRKKSTSVEPVGRI